MFYLTTVVNMIGGLILVLEVHRLAESIPCNRFLGSLNFYKFGLSVWVLPVISLLLTNTVLPVHGCLSIHMGCERFCGAQKEEEPQPWPS